MKKIKHYYILSLNANDIMETYDIKKIPNSKPEVTPKDYVFDVENKKKYRCIHESLMLDYLMKYDKEFKEKFSDDYNIYTLSLINIKFNDSEVKWEDNKQTYNHKGTRKYFYTNGFTLNGIKYVNFQRSSSKARTGNCLFIKESLLEHMLDWIRIGLEITGAIDIGSLRAYESLTSSDIIDRVKIKPEEILVVDDVKGFCLANQSITKYDSEKKEFYVENVENVEVNNDIFDGESLLDESKFTGKYKNSGFMLLRNHFFKTAAFNTNLQQYFKDNNITELIDKWNVPHKADEIKMITTPNSIKLFKFAGKIKADEEKLNDEKTVWNYLKEHLLENWGICKTEHSSKQKDFFDDTQQMSYQFINSMPLTKEEVREIVKLEIDYANLIKDDIDEFFKYASITDTKQHNFLLRMAAINPQFLQTKYFKDYEAEQHKCRKEAIQKGKIRIKDTDNMTFLGNPLELLRHACKQELREGQIHTGYEVYSNKYEDGTELAMFRSPHLAAGNVALVTNKRLEDIDKYFNLTNNIIVINSYDSDIYNRLQGADLDSDFALVTSNKLIVEKARLCQKWYTPVNGIKGKKKNRTLTEKNITYVDKKISSNDIGRICNFGQVLNSYMWDFYFKGDIKAADEIYKFISELSTLSQIEIDKAKKSFDGIKRISKEIGDLKLKVSELGIARDVEYKYKDKDGNNKTKVKTIIPEPLFFKQKDLNENRHKKFGKKTIIDEEYTKLNCPMDNLIDITEEDIKTKKYKKTVDVKDILTSFKGCQKTNVTYKKIIELATDTQQSISECYDKDNIAKYIENRDKQEELIIKELSKLKIEQNVFIGIIKATFDSDIKIPRNTLKWLWDAQTKAFEKVIKKMK